MIGPNCMGVATPGAPSPWIGTLTEHFTAGPVATLAHSGSIGEILVSLGPRIGFRTVVSAGNETVTDVADMTAYFAEDPRVPGGRPVPGDRPPPGRVRGGAAADRRGGQGRGRAQGRHLRDGRAAALAHTGALVGSDRWFSAMLRYYNAIRCDDFGIWLEHLEVFSRETPPAAGGSAPSPTRAARASTSPTRPSRPGSRSSPCRTSCGQDQGGVPQLHRCRQPGRLLGDRRRPGRLPARASS